MVHWLLKKCQLDMGIADKYNEIIKQQRLKCEKNKTKMLKMKAHRV